MTTPSPATKAGLWNISTCCLTNIISFTLKGLRRNPTPRHLETRHQDIEFYDEEDQGNLAAKLKAASAG